MVVEESATYVLPGERMRRIQTRMVLESRSGIQAGQRDQYLAFCQEHEQTILIEPGALYQRDTDNLDEDEISWEDFGNWHDH